VGGLGAGLDGGVDGSNGSELLVGGSCSNNSPEGGDRPVDNLLEVGGFAGNNPPELSMEGGRLSNNSSKELGGDGVSSIVIIQGGTSISSVFGDVVWIADAGAGEGMHASVDGKGPGSCSPPSAKTKEGSS